MPNRHPRRCSLDQTRPSANARAPLQRVSTRSFARPNNNGRPGRIIGGGRTWTEETGADERGRQKYRPQFDQAGTEGQVSIPEQNDTVKELAGPSQHLLPASSSAASGTSKLRVSSSKWTVTCSVMLADPLCLPRRRIVEKNTVSNSLFGVCDKPCLAFVPSLGQPEREPNEIDWASKIREIAPFRLRRTVGSE